MINVARETPPIRNATGTWHRWEVTDGRGVVLARGWRPGRRENAIEAARQAEARLAKLRDPVRDWSEFHITPRDEHDGRHLRRFDILAR